jgi:hypothetical protein
MAGHRRNGHHSRMASTKHVHSGFSDVFPYGTEAYIVSAENDLWDVAWDSVEPGRPGAVTVPGRRSESRSTRAG